MVGRVFVPAWREKGSPVKHQQTLDRALGKKQRGNGLWGVAFSSRNYIQAQNMSFLRKEIFPSAAQLQLGWSWRREKNCSEPLRKSFFYKLNAILQNKN
jgi:hypothetical protein